MTTESTLSSTDTESRPVALGHPIAFMFFFWGEFAERCSYYGMRAILPRYLSEQLHLGDEWGGTVYYWFKMGCYGLPLLGGFIADRYLGKYRTIVGFAIPYVLGHFILGIESLPAAMIALVLLACGSGVIKPNISTLMGETYDQQRPGQLQLRSSAFLWFYFSINIGALISQVALPYIRGKDNYATAFQFPAWLMVISLAVFASGKGYYAKETTKHQTPTPEQRRERWVTVSRLLGIFGLITLFWIPYEHNDGLWVYFARDYIDLHIPLTSIELAPDQLQFINPLCVIIFAPLFGWLFPKIDPESRFFTVNTKILIGLVIGALSSGIMTIAGFLASADAKISALWLVFAYVLLTIGEVLVYGTGLELAFAAAPPNMKGFITGCFLLTMTIANFFNSFWVKKYGGSLIDGVGKPGTLLPGTFFGISGLFTVTAVVLMIIVSRKREQLPVVNE